MTKDSLRLGDRTCAIYRAGEPQVALVQPADGRDLASLERQARYIREGTDRPFLLCALPVEDWNRDLSPWPAPPVYGQEPFRGGGARTLELLSGAVLPALRARYGALETVIGGYSLAGLFALWCGYEMDLFAAVAAVSPSVWFDGWTEYAAARKMRAGAVYLSLGDREERARKERLARVGDCIRAQKAMLDREVVPAALVWEPGNHFQNVPERTAGGFLWAMGRTRRSAEGALSGGTDNGRTSL